jgi:hypothetical protein
MQLAEKKYAWASDAEVHEKEIRVMEKSIFQWLKHVSRNMPEAVKFPRRIRKPTRERIQIVERAFEKYLNELEGSLKTHEERPAEGRPVGKLGAREEEGYEPTEEEIEEFVRQDAEYEAELDEWHKTDLDLIEKEDRVKPQHPRRTGPPVGYGSEKREFDPKAKKIRQVLATRAGEKKKAEEALRDPGYYEKKREDEKLREMERELERQGEAQKQKAKQKEEAEEEKRHYKEKWKEAGEGLGLEEDVRRIFKMILN